MYLQQNKLYIFYRYTLYSAVKLTAENVENLTNLCKNVKKIALKLTAKNAVKFRNLLLTHENPNCCKFTATCVGIILRECIAVK